MLAMSLLLAVFEPATTAASMAIDRPKTIDDAPDGRGPARLSRWAARPQRSGGRRRETPAFARMGAAPFASRGMGRRPRGRKSTRRRCGLGDRGTAGLRPDQAKERPCARVRLNSNLREKTWRTSVARHKRSKSSSVEKGIRGAEKGGLAARARAPHNDDLRLDARLSRAGRWGRMVSAARGRAARSFGRTNHRKTPIRLKPRRRIGLLYRLVCRGHEAWPSRRLRRELAW